MASPVKGEDNQRKSHSVDAMAADRERTDGRKTRGQRSETLVSEARQRILQDIIHGDVQPGSVIQISALAERYGVSRTPVREALALLEQEGLVSAIAYKGYLVRSIEPSDVRDVYLVRKIIEGAAAGLAAARIEGDLVAELRKLRPPQVKTMTLQYDEYANRFHRTIVQAAHSPRLLGLFDQVYNDVRRIQYAGIGNPRPDLIHMEHEEILHALDAQDGDRARELMENHIDAIRRRAMEAWISG